MPSERPRRSRPRRAAGRPHLHLTGATLSFALVAVAAGMPSVFLPLQQQAWGFSTTALALSTGLYSFVVLATLLVLGSLSDHLGRRPVIIAGLALELVALVLLALAQSITVVLSGRVVQAVATGLLSSGLSAYITEIATARTARLASAAAAAIPLLGLGIGTVVGGIAIRVVAAPQIVAFGGLAAVTTALLVGAVFAAETRAAQAGALASLRPRIGVPPSVRPAFVRAAPLLATTWAAAGMFLGIVPAAVRPIFGLSDSADVGGLVLLFTVAASAGVLIAGALRGERAVVSAIPAVVGSAVVASAVESSSLVLLIVATIVLGFGAGGCFAVALRVLTSAAPADVRGAVFASAYTVNYIAFGVPVIVAGRLLDLLAPRLPLVLFCALLALLGTWGLVASSKASGRSVTAQGGA